MSSSDPDVVKSVIARRKREDGLWVAWEPEADDDIEGVGANEFEAVIDYCKRQRSKNNVGGRNNTKDYCEEDCIAALRDVRSRVDFKRLTTSEYRFRRDGSMPSERTIVRRFGSWDKAKQAAFASDDDSIQEEAGQ